MFVSELVELCKRCSIERSTQQDTDIFSCIWPVFFFIIVQRASGIRLLVWSEPAHVQFISEVNKAVLSCETSVSKTHMIRGILELCFAISQHFK